MNNYTSDIQLAARYEVSRATIWRWAARGILPQPVQLSPGCTRWIKSEIDARDAALQSARRKPRERKGASV